MNSEPYVEALWLENCTRVMSLATTHMELVKYLPAIITN